MTKRIARITKQCETCGNPFIVTSQDVVRRPARFCSPDCHNNRRKPSVEELFLKRRGPTTDSGCILWTGSVTRDGYGKFHANIDGRRVTLLANRVAWELVNGQIAEGMCVLHTCDNPPCVNVDHLFLGSDADNVADKVSKGRQAKGEKMHLAKLTSNDVLQIRNKYAQGGVSYNTIAKEYGVKKDAIGCIIRGSTWRHV